MTKKLINNPDDVVDEMIEGILASHGDRLRRLDSHPRALVRTGAPAGGKVGILIGGGSGHEPAFIGFIGPGMADAVTIGNVFAAPPPDPIVEATKAIDGGAGVLYLYGNYAGDVMNFDMAAEMCGLEGIDVRQVRINDDVSSAPTDRRDERRGIAGDIFVFKVAAAAADRRLSLDEIERLAHHARERTRTMGVGLSPGSTPATLKPNFHLGPDEIEFGIGGHGEPGVERTKIQPADAITDSLLRTILDDMPIPSGERVAMIVNGCGSTALMELYIVARRAHRTLADRGIAVHSTIVGSFITTMEMAGCSITLMHLDDTLTDLLEAPADCLMLKTPWDGAA